MIRTCNNIEVQAVKARPIPLRRRFRFFMPLPRVDMIERVFIAAERAYGLTGEELTRHTNAHRIGRPRMCVVHMIRLQLSAMGQGQLWGAMTTKDIGLIFGRSDHTFAIYCSKCVKNAIAGYDPEMLELWERLQSSYLKNGT